MEAEIITQINEEIEELDNKFYPKYHPFNEFILVRDVGEDSGLKKSKTGRLYLPDMKIEDKQGGGSNENLMEVEVVAVSDGIFNENTGEYRTPRVKEGDHLWISTHHRSRNPQPWGKEEVRIIQEADVVTYLSKTEYEKQLEENESA